MHYTRSVSAMTFGFSGLTSAPILVADAAQISISLVSATTASTYTVQGSNDDGFTSAIANWSTVSAIGAQGIYAIQPGMRWLRAIEAASTSSATVIFTMTTR